ncbi:Glutathione S-transferase (GST class-sigma) [Durusdinium trenchii]|uniref:Glutathione S-transferase (GST class-sigma) n=1 Tax=Durusdinium trenchii TaxID=1381693 RepID=A0ABP0NTD9_9DINO
MSSCFSCFSGMTRSQTSKDLGKVKLHYFNVFAKGPAIALALHHGNLDWEGEFPSAWKDMKPQTPFGELPVLEVPGQGLIGQEAAILHYLALKEPLLAGADDEEMVTSFQILGAAEDIYQKLSKYQNTIGVVDKCSLEQLSAFWDSADESKHARERGLNAHLAFLEKFYMKAAQRLGNAGKFTKKGISIGECKLFTVLHCLVMIKPTVLEHFQGLSTFYNRFKSLEKTQDILQNGGRFPGPFKQYFIA